VQMLRMGRGAQVEWRPGRRSVGQKSPTKVQDAQEATEPTRGLRRRQS
jgi:hypothetical protein